MKTFFPFSFLFVLLVLATCLFTESYGQNFTKNEKDEFFADFYVVEAKPMRFVLTYHRPVMDRVGVRITDKAGQVLYVEKALVYKQYKKIFDLSTFGDGRYTFELSDGDQVFIKSFEIATMVVRTAVIRNKDTGRDWFVEIR